MSKLELELRSLREELTRVEGKREVAEEEITHLRKSAGRCCSSSLLLPPPPSSSLLLRVLPPGGSK